jgi:hypothetical protein
VVADARAGAILADSTHTVEGAVWIYYDQTPTPTRLGAEAIADADGRGVGVVADAFAGAILADSTHSVEGAVWIFHIQAPTPTRLGAEAIADADCRGAGVVADASAGAILADSTHSIEGAVWNFYFRYRNNIGSVTSNDRGSTGHPYISFQRRNGHALTTSEGAVMDG